MSTAISIAERLDLLDEVFLPSSPIHTEELLAGRVTQRGNLLEMSRTKGGHAAIYGMRGVGKTSVAAVFEAGARELGHLVVRVNCGEGASFEDLIYEIAIELQDILPDEWSEWIAQRLTSYTQGDVVRLFLALSQEARLIVILDEFDLITNDGVTRQLANLMKALADKHADAHIVVVGVAESVNAIMQGHASVARGLVQVGMPLLEREELDNILAVASDRLDVRFPDLLRARVLGLSNRLPHYTHLLGKELARRAILAERDEVLLEDWSDALVASVSKAQQTLVDIYSQATTTAKPSMFEPLLLSCALAAKDEQGYFRPADVNPHLNSISGKTYALASFTGNLASLAKVERGPALEAKIFADKRNRYRFANPLLQPYVLLRAVQEGRIDIERIDDGTLWSQDRA